MPDYRQSLMVAPAWYLDQKAWAPAGTALIALMVAYYLLDIHGNRRR